MNPPEMAHVATRTFAVSSPGLARYGLAPADTGNSKPHRTINVVSRSKASAYLVLSGERFFILYSPQFHLGLIVQMKVKKRASRPRICPISAGIAALGANCQCEHQCLREDERVGFTSEE